MKRLYWRPQRVSRRILVLLALVAVAGLMSVETFLVRKKQAFYREKLSAARLALQAFEVLHQERVQRGIAIDPETDPARTGLIGVAYSETTTNSGHLPAKQLSVNPNFAAVVVHLLKRSGVEAGDTVAVGMSGSFPAINVAVLAGMQTLDVHPIVISGAGASQWGANVPNFLWLDMERALYDHGVLRIRSVVASIGGIEDRGLGLSAQSRALLRAGIDRNEIPFLDVGSYEESVERRMAVYEANLGDGEVKAYINVGGGTASVGTRVGKRMFRPGLNLQLPVGAGAIDSVMTRFARRGVPVIHFSHIADIAERYGLPTSGAPSLAAVGQGTIFFRLVHNVWLTLGVLALLALLLVGFVRLDWGYRLLSSTPRKSGSERPEPMV